MNISIPDGYLKEGCEISIIVRLQLIENEKVENSDQKEEVEIIIRKVDGIPICLSNVDSTVTTSTTPNSSKSSKKIGDVKMNNANEVPMACDDVSGSFKSLSSTAGDADSISSDCQSTIIPQSSLVSSIVAHNDSENMSILDSDDVECGTKSEFPTDTDNSDDDDDYKTAFGFETCSNLSSSSQKQLNSEEKDEIMTSVNPYSVTRDISKEDNAADVDDPIRRENDATSFSPYSTDESPVAFNGKKIEILLNKKF